MTNRQAVRIANDKARKARAFKRNGGVLGAFISFLVAGL